MLNRSTLRPYLPAGAHCGAGEWFALTIAACESQHGRGELACRAAADCRDAGAGGRGPGAAGCQADPVAAVIQTLADSGVHPDLRWPRFADYQEALRQAYAPGQFAPLWTHGGQPTAQAGEVIAGLATAGTKGLDAGDYDAARLAAEAERLRNTAAPSAAALGTLDVAVTV